MNKTIIKNGRKFIIDQEKLDKLKTLRYGVPVIEVSPQLGDTSSSS